jgi:hypothetical protein
MVTTHDTLEQKNLAVLMFILQAEMEVVSRCWYWCFSPNQASSRGKRASRAASLGSFNTGIFLEYIISDNPDNSHPCIIAENLSIELKQSLVSIYELSFCERTERCTQCKAKKKQLCTLHTFIHHP